ncbi:UDP-N-acetylmuramoyl-L-alanyl-D-glutamate--2,6-diaminopimelate ligase [Marinicella gelatinilytica]|uniref:UDP-N-acetylmuramoyl-L-alanyl-D-glutamate--2, 6-diaminopimelate ligase n=1 Tax=Marinicella gelatinilytica TaxID=2996017 RepID=UPI002260F21B|nr:UDP-N-acetylmuramoyl-L-alanyl-D-glutamate--2,6-diaminopimelate ligase [Marinicella gelatinilytica]MCX7545152.1 UDP-N-acetylmuramoyl-L-alanyl-D-glutamate--2,6-diaminopimelate ligase [Marinicella gelatinilytica]
MANYKLLSQLLNCVEARQTTHVDLHIKGLAIDSREVKSGDLFLALSGHHKHGIAFAEQAEQNGAVAIFAEAPINSHIKQLAVTIPVYEIKQLSGQLGKLAAFFFDHPSERMKIMAVTGTNGKTSTAWLLVQALQAFGVNAAYMGTLGLGDAKRLKPLANTTPSALHIQSNLAELLNQGITHVCIEASSHALVQGRLNGLRIDTGIFTNISQDHLDYHQTMQAYSEAKQQLFTQYALRHAVINGDDDYASQWLKEGINADLISVYGQQQTKNNDIKHHHTAQNVELSEVGITFDWRHDNEQHRITTQLLGRFNVDNLLAVMSSLTEAGFQATDIITVVAQLNPVPGRMNTIHLPHKQVTVVIDFAHTPDALAQVLNALAAHCQHELWCVFGCGGDRDRGKRPQMGGIAESYADRVIITDDNPRFESAAQITADIALGMKKPPQIIHNRQTAIEEALLKAVTGDVVLIAGKGHETTQQIKDQYHEFSDFQVVQKWLEKAA